MVILRATRKLHALLPSSTTAPGVSDTALGDWYVNQFTVDRQPLLLLVSSLSLLPMLIRARDVRGLPDRLPRLVAARLGRCGIPAPVIAAETAAMSPVHLAPTASRSILGTMVDFAHGVPYYLEPWRWGDEALFDVEARLAETPCFASGRREDVIYPDRTTVELLNTRWLADLPAGGKLTVH